MSQASFAQNKTLTHFFKNIMVRLGHYGWEIEFAGESFCWKYRKVIVVGDKAKNKKQMILHEIAHIDTARFCNQKHNYGFWKHFDDLMRRFLPDERICEEQIELRRWTTKGIITKEQYKLVYAP